MATKTEWKIEQETDTAHNRYLASLAGRGVLQEFEEICDHVDKGGMLHTESAAQFVARARAACKK